MRIIINAWKKNILYQKNKYIKINLIKIFE